MSLFQQYLIMTNNIELTLIAIINPSKKRRVIEYKKRIYEVFFTNES